MRLRLGRDVIDARRYLGYQFIGDRPATVQNVIAASAMDEAELVAAL
jgi:hypothetical protein